MLDGRIDTQGPVKELRARGVLDDITHDEAAEAAKEEQEAAEEAAIEEAPKTDEPEGDEPSVKGKAPRKLIEEEHRETGTVKWSIYKTYLKASYVAMTYLPALSSYYFFRSYWTWVILFMLIVLNQLLGVGEKVWIKVREDVCRC